MAQQLWAKSVEWEEAPPSRAWHMGSRSLLEEWTLV